MHKLYKFNSNVKISFDLYKRKKKKKSENAHTQNPNISQVHSTSLNINKLYQQIVEKARPFYQLNGPSVRCIFKQIRSFAFLSERAEWHKVWNWVKVNPCNHVTSCKRRWRNDRQKSSVENGTLCRETLHE